MTQHTHTYTLTRALNSEVTQHIAQGREKRTGFLLRPTVNNCEARRRGAAGGPGCIFNNGRLLVPQGASSTDKATLGVVATVCMILQMSPSTEKRQELLTRRVEKGESEVVVV